MKTFYVSAVVWFLKKKLISCVTLFCITGNSLRTLYALCTHSSPHSGELLLGDFSFLAFFSNTTSNITEIQTWMLNCCILKDLGLLLCAKITETVLMR